jgi:hypothetical protein
LEGDRGGKAVGLLARSGKGVRILGREEATTRAISRSSEESIEVSREERTSIVTNNVHQLGLLEAHNIRVVPEDVVAHNITLIDLAKATNIPGKNNEIAIGPIHG